MIGLAWQVAAAAWRRCGLGQPVEAVQAVEPVPVSAAAPAVILAAAPSPRSAAPLQMPCPVCGHIAYWWWSFDPANEGTRYDRIDCLVCVVPVEAVA